MRVHLQYSTESTKTFKNRLRLRNNKGNPTKPSYLTKSNTNYQIYEFTTYLPGESEEHTNKKKQKSKMNIKREWPSKGFKMLMQWLEESLFGCFKTGFVPCVLRTANKSPDKTGRDKNKPVSLEGGAGSGPVWGRWEMLVIWKRARDGLTTTRG